MEILENQVPALSREQFMSLYEGIFENSPWVAARAWEMNDSATLVNPLLVHSKLVEVVKQASLAEKLRLLCAHPELAGKEAQEGSMTEHSVVEQASAGLDALRKDEMTRLAALNAAYREKHGFPFIVAVRCYSKAQIFEEIAKRLENDTQSELLENLNQIFAITRFRVIDSVPINAG